MVDPKKIIIALDYDDIDNALALADNLNPDLCRLKIGKELFTKYGPEIVIQIQQKGFEIYLLFVIQRNDCSKFQLAKDIDPEYCELLIKAVKKNLKILCYDCKFSSKGIKLNNKIKLNI